MLSRGGGKVKNYKYSGNYQSPKTMNLAVILSQIPRKSRFLRLIPPENQKIPTVRFFTAELGPKYIHAHEKSIPEKRRSQAGTASRVRVACLADSAR